MSGYDLSIGDYLRSRRKEKGMTLIELATASGVSHPYISQVENGKFSPSPEILRKLAGPLGEDCDDLMVRAGHTDAASSNNKSVSYAASVIIDNILEITSAAKDRSPLIAPYINHIEYFEKQLETGRSGGETSISQLKNMLWEFESDGDSRQSLIGSRSDARQIEGLLKALEDVLADRYELRTRRKSSEVLKELTHYLDQPDIAYYGHPLTDQDRQRILDMLKALFPQYVEKGAD